MTLYRRLSLGCKLTSVLMLSFSLTGCGSATNNLPTVIEGTPSLQKTDKKMKKAAVDVNQRGASDN